MKEEEMPKIMFPKWLEAKFGDDFYLRLKDTPESLELLLEFTKMIAATIKEKKPE